MGSDPHPMLTLSLAVGFGILLTALARRLKLPTIILLLLAGFLMGPEGLNWIQPDSLDSILPVIVSFAIGIILFEGGLTLTLKDYAHASTVIRRLLTWGVLVTWLGGTALIWWIFKFDFSFALLAASLVIVTGPTVVIPLLRRIQAVPRVASILHWEGVLIDAIGVFIAVLCFEWVVVGAGGQAFLNLALRVVVGFAFGAGGGWLIERTLRLRWIPEEMTNIYVLASGILLYGLSETIISESGLLTATLAGLYLGWKAPLELREIRSFKAEITDLMIGMLFLLLVARLEFSQFLSFGWPGMLLVFGMMFLIRPLSVLVCSWGIEIPWREKAFLSWVAPRGIVAASLASLFSLNLAQNNPGLGDPLFLESFTYSMICATVVIQGFSAGILGRWLGVRRPDPVGWLIIGAHAFGRALAAMIFSTTGRPVVLIDTNVRNVQRAQSEGCHAFHEDALAADALLERTEFQSVGHLIALTDNVELNQLILRQWERHLGRFNVFAWKPLTPSGHEQPAGGFHHHSGIFGNVALPSLISGEMERKEAAIDTILPPDIDDGPLADRAHPLCIIRQHTVTPLASDHLPPGAVRPGDQIIVLHRSKGYLRQALLRGAFLEPETAQVEAIFRQLVMTAARLQPGINTDVALQDLLRQHQTFPADLGNGAAIPHFYSTEIRHALCLVARPSMPIPFSNGTMPIRILFLVVSPQNQPEAHLGLMAEISRCCFHAPQLESLLAAETFDDFLKEL